MLSVCFLNVCSVVDPTDLTSFLKEAKQGFSYVRYYDINLGHVPSFTWGDKYLFGDEPYSTVAEAAGAPGVVLVGIVSAFNPYFDFRVRRKHLHNNVLAYYDVKTQKLHFGTSKESVGIYNTFLSEFKVEGDGRDDTARILFVDLEESDELFDTFEPDSSLAYKSVFEGLRDRMHRNYDTQSAEERARNLSIYAALVDIRLSRSEENIEDEDVDELASELKSLQEIEALWPEAFAAAYAMGVKPGMLRTSLFLPFPYYDTRAPLCTFHLTRAADFFTNEDMRLIATTELDDKKHDEYIKAACAAGREVLAWPVSTRCCWITACLQLGLSEGAAVAVHAPLAKRVCA